MKEGSGINKVHNALPKISNTDTSNTDASTTSSEQCLTQAQVWLSDCLGSHTHCNSQLSEDAWWPSRLVEILDQENTSDIRVIVTAEHPSCGPYLTLSHCWGAADFIKLTLQNITQLQAGFSLHDLPKTFQEAIAVAVALEIRYVWIDSLCIIQNSVDDWQREASRMSEVYQHAICNIAATHAFDSSHGLFTKRVEWSTRTFRSHRTTAPKPDRWSIQSIIANAKSSTRTFYVIDPDIWVESVEHAPLLGRGWVVQERLLARRVLHFTEGELFWECREKRACQTYPEKIPRSSVMSAIPKNMILEPERWDNIGKKSSLMSRIILYWRSDDGRSSTRGSIWPPILKWYSGAKLTNPGDKEAAIYGVVKILEETFQDTCVAGLWVRQLFSQLLWECTPHQPSVICNSRAPTWSCKFWVSHYFRPVILRTNYAHKSRLSQHYDLTSTYVVKFLIV